MDTEKKFAEFLENFQRKGQKYENYWIGLVVCPSAMHVRHYFDIAANETKVDMVRRAEKSITFLSGARLLFREGGASVKFLAGYRVPSVLILRPRDYEYSEERMAFLRGLNEFHPQREAEFAEIVL